MTPRSLLLGAALVAALAAAIPASFFDPPASDLLLHGHMAAGAAATLQEHGWTAFQDPWFHGVNWGAPLFHSYPRLAHQVAAVLSLATGIDPYACVALLMGLAVVALPLATYQGARWLGLAPDRAALAAVVAATLRSADAYGHSPLSYGFDSAGLLPQAMGGALAALGIGAWLCASAPTGDSALAGRSHAIRIAVAAVVVSLAARCHLPSGWIAAVIAAVLLLARVPDRRSVIRFGLVGLGAAVLSIGFLHPFAADLSAVHDIARGPEGRSYGAARVLRELASGVYLDGGRPGLWTPAFAIGLWILIRRRAAPLQRGLVAATAVILVLFAGRATWGLWMSALPVLGRFHDQRYLLGLHLLAPLVVAVGAVEILAPLRRRDPRAPTLVGFLAVGMATVLTVGAAGTQLRLVQGARADLAAWEPSVAPLLDRLEALPDGGGVAMAGPDVLAGSTTTMSWLIRRGVPSVGRTLHHYTHGYEVAGWTSRDHAEPLTDEQAQVLLLQGRVTPDLALLPTGSRDVDLVCSDLLLTTAGPSLNGFGVAWWQSGAWLARQHPTIDLGVGAGPDPARYRRTGSIDAPDPSLLAGLPVCKEGGQIRSASPPVRGAGARRVTVQVDQPGRWLRFGQSWHPRWEVTVDGAPSRPFLLLPGNIGVPLEPGEHEVVLTWRVPAWRGALAGLNVLLVLGLLGIGLGPRRWARGEDQAG